MTLKTASINHKRHTASCRLYVTPANVYQMTILLSTKDSLMLVTGQYHHPIHFVSRTKKLWAILLGALYINQIDTRTQNINSTNAYRRKETTSGFLARVTQIHNTNATAPLVLALSFMLLREAIASGAKVQVVLHGNTEYIFSSTPCDYVSVSIQRHVTRKMWSPCPIFLGARSVIRRKGTCCFFVVFAFGMIHHIYSYFTHRIPPRYLSRAIHAAVSPPPPASNAPFFPITRTIA